MKRLWFFLLVLVVILAIPAGATQVTDGEPSTFSTVENFETSEFSTISNVETLSVDNNGPTELEYLESINTYAMYLFAFGVVWLVLKLCSLVYRLLRIFI